MPVSTEMMSRIILRVSKSWQVCRHASTLASTVNQSQFYIGGQRVKPTSTDEFKVFEPATNKVLCTTYNACAEDVDLAVQSAKEGFKIWSQLSGFERGKILYKAAALAREHADELTKAECIDTGKPIYEAKMDIDGCLDTLEFSAGLAADIAGQHIPVANGSFMYTRREPWGVCGCIGAWNFPFQMVLWKSSPALACGNAVVFKPSQFTPLTAVMMAEIYTEAGLPPGCFNVIQGAAQTGQLLSSHPKVSKMSFTGSVQGGSSVMANCAKNLTAVTLELGGKSPIVIFEDCDIDNAVKGAMLGNFLSQGQVCSNGTRVFVHRSIVKPFLEKLVARTKEMKIGDPLDWDTRVGSMIHGEQAQKTLDYIEIAKKEGATVLCGGERVIPDPKFAGGHFISPCILTDVTDDMRVAREEVFGSVMCVMVFDTEEEVIERANDSEFGLAAGVFTKDLARTHRVVAQFEAGSIYVNNYNVYPPGIPFGGYKQSGFGRENAAVAFEFYTQIKSVYVEMNDVDSPL